MRPVWSVSILLGLLNARYVPLIQPTSIILDNGHWLREVFLPLQMQESDSDACIR